MLDCKVLRQEFPSKWLLDRLDLRYTFPRIHRFAELAKVLVNGCKDRRLCKFQSDLSIRQEVQQTMACPTQKNKTCVQSVDLSRPATVTC